MQELIANEIGAEVEDAVSYEIQWIIPNWRQVRQDVNLVRDLKATFETGQQPHQMIQTKWLVGLKDVQADYMEMHQLARVYWQLLDIKGSGSQAKLDVKVVTKLCLADGNPEWIDEQTGKLSLYDSIEEKMGYLDVGIDDPYMDGEFISDNGAIQYKLILTIKTPEVDSSLSKKLKLEQFSKRSHDQLRENLAALFNEDPDGDLKIVTRDGVSLCAHRNILKFQCPVFVGMLNSDLSENITGILKVDDLSGKTMKILLHYCYTGDLLDGWSDDDTIVEFTFGAGKYQMTQVLELLDDLLGRGGARDEVSNLDAQLLDLSGKLSLRNAEKRILQRVIKKVAAAKSGEELFQLFGYHDEEISRKAEMMAVEQIGRSKVLEILAFALGNADQQQEEFSRNGLSLLALVQRNESLKDLEEILLKRFAKITSKFITAEEVFALFGSGK